MSELFCDDVAPPERKAKDAHIHDVGECCECGGDHCCGSSRCPIGSNPDTCPERSDGGAHLYGHVDNKCRICGAPFVP